MNALHARFLLPCSLAAVAASIALQSGAQTGAQIDAPGAVQSAQGVARASAPVCVPSLIDQADASCLQASSTPTLGRLYPLSPNLFVDASSGHVGLGTLAPASRLDVNGTTTTRVLTITGGADLVEHFETSGDECAPGTVLAIDPEQPGQLRASRGAYDSRVAGVVSGAGGLQPGLTLGQAGVTSGATPVALTGRVYVRCTAENGAIAPGDLLTTAGTPGRAMKATDAARSFGAVLGKAMSTLADGEGLVLVLVSLQ